MILTEQQQLAVEKLGRNKVGALFMEMGTGKTMTAVALANSHAKRYDLILWLAPVSTLKNAEREITKDGGTTKPIRFVGYESIASSDRIYLNLLRELEGKRVFLICDESLYLKNGDSKRHQRVKNIRNQFAEFTLLLNGTPMSRDEMDIFFQMDLLSPLILGLNERDFKNIMFTEVKFKKKGQKEQTFYKRCQKNLPWLKSAIAPYVYECDLSLDVVCEESEEVVRVSQYTRNIYEEEKSRLLDAIKNHEDMVIMGQLSKMRRIVACDRQKNTAIANMVAGKRSIVFCQFRDELDQIVHDTKNGAYAIDGDTPIPDRDEILDNWRKGDKPLVIMAQCGSFGLNLQDSDLVVFASLPWDYAEYSQALHRIYRLGQKSKKIRVIRFKQRIGISNIVEQCLWTKLTLAEFVKQMDWTNFISKKVLT